MTSLLGLVTHGRDGHAQRIFPSCLIKLAFVNVFKDVNTINTHNFLIKHNCPIVVSKLSSPRVWAHRTARLTAHSATCWKSARARSRRGRGASWASPRTTPPSSASATAPSPATKIKRLPRRLQVSLHTLPQPCQNINIVSVLDGHKWTDSLRINKRKMSHEVPDDKDKDKPSDWILNRFRTFSFS